jgi:uncharacterized membrane protein HdeD (DUF308 family)
MKTQAKKLKWNMILMSGIYLVLGIVLLMWPEAVKSVICYVIGGIVMLAGLVQVIRFFLAKDRMAFAPLTLTFGAVCLALGGFLIVRSDVVWTVLPIVFGLFVVFDSVLRMQNALELKRSEARNWWVFLLLALLSIVLGGVMIYDPFGSTDLLIMAIGVILLVESALNLISSLYTFAVVRRFVKSHPAAEAVAEALTGKDLDGSGAVGDLGTGDTVEGTAVERDAQEDEAPSESAQPADSTVSDAKNLPEDTQ